MVFPSDEQVKSKLGKGLTDKQLVAFSGENNNGRSAPCVDCSSLAFRRSELSTSDGSGVRCWFYIFSGVFVLGGISKLVTFALPSGSDRYA